MLRRQGRRFGVIDFLIHDRSLGAEHLADQRTKMWVSMSKRCRVQ